MCGLVGWINNKENILNKKNLIKSMTKLLKFRGPDDTGYYFKEHVLLGHKRLSIIDPKNGKQPYTYKDYTIVYNGELYNTENIKNILINNGFKFDSKCDTEVLLKAYIHFKEKVLNILEGIYAFAIIHNNEIFIARDRLGVKPLFYSNVLNNFIFASEIKAILKSKIVKPIIDKNGLQELLALGPSKTPGSGIFKDIYELKPGHYFIYKNNKLKIKRYWNIKNLEFNDSFEECKNKVRELVEEAIKRQMVSDVGIATLLSGGLDSSIITAICSIELNKIEKKLDTYSIDYEENEKHFIPNDFQVTNDKDFIKLISDKFNTKHSFKIISQSMLAKTLKEALYAKDYPGMADIDSSLYWFSKEIKKDHKVILSGECADEIFGGYPWFYKKELLNRKGFPWISNLKERNNLLNDNIKKKINLEKYAHKAYKKTLKDVPKVKNKDEQNKKNLFYLNMNWFMTTLLDRKDRMTMRGSIEARVPFADHHLIEYLWNTPWSYKYYNDQEKGLLREAFKDILPEKIVNRKKNPYPKTHHPIYAKIVSEMLKERLINKDSIIPKIFNIEKINNLIETNGSSYKSPWFGQLMTGPQLLAYLYQFDVWANKYKIIFKI